MLRHTTGSASPESRWMSIRGEQRRSRLALFTAGAVALAFLLLLVPVEHYDAGLLIVAGVVAAALVAVAAASSIAPAVADLALPFGYLILVAVLRAAEGGAGSGLGGLFIVPVIWLGLTAGRAAIAWGVAAIIAAQVIPLLAVGSPEYPSSGWRGTLVLTTVAALAGFTIEALLSEARSRARENARLFESAATWSTRLESLAEAGNALAGETRVERLLEIAAERLRELLSARVVVVLLSVEGGRLRCAAAAGEGAADLVGQVVSPPPEHAALALDPQHGRIDESAAFDLTGGRPGLWVPMATRDRSIGVLAAFGNLRNPDGVFTQDDLRLSEIFAARAGLAVDLSERAAGDVVRRVVSAQETERRRLARELHDETGQALTSMLMQLKTLEGSSSDENVRGQVRSLRETAVETLRGVRRIVVELRPKALDDLGLVPALERLAASVSEKNGVDVSFDAGQFDGRFAPEVEAALYRIVQEGLTNVVKHAHAREATVLLAPTGESVLLVIADDGRGFDLTIPANGGFGLIGMRERVQLLGGKIAIETSVEGSTSLIIEVPIS